MELKSGCLSLAQAKDKLQCEKLTCPWQSRPRTIGSNGELVVSKVCSVQTLVGLQSQQVAYCVTVNIIFNVYGLLLL